MPDQIVRITGGEQLYQTLERTSQDVAKAIVRKALRSAAQVWYAEMKARVRQGWHTWETTVAGKGRSKQRFAGRSREWGALSRLIGIKVAVRGDELGGVAQVGPVRKGFWALFLEFGTRHSPAFPFIRQSFEAKKQDVLDRYVQAAREELRKLGLK